MGFEVVLATDVSAGTQKFIRVSLSSASSITTLLLIWYQVGFMQTPSLCKNLLIFSVCVSNFFVVFITLAAGKTAA
jgi:hypothetical protein